MALGSNLADVIIFKLICEMLLRLFCLEIVIFKGVTTNPMSYTATNNIGQGRMVNDQKYGPERFEPTTLGCSPSIFPISRLTSFF